MARQRTLVKRGRKAPPEIVSGNIATNLDAVRELLLDKKYLMSKALDDAIELLELSLSAHEEYGGNRSYRCEKERWEVLQEWTDRLAAYKSLQALNAKQSAVKP